MDFNRINAVIFWMAVIFAIILSIVASNASSIDDPTKDIATFCWIVAGVSFSIWIIGKILNSSKAVETNENALKEQNAQIAKLQKELDELKRGVKNE